MKKICVLVSYEEPTSTFLQIGDVYQDPGLYVNTHLFDVVPIKKVDEVESIKAIINKGYDWIWSFLWGSETHADSAVAGMLGTKYMESISYPFIGTSSKFLNAGKIELKTCLANTPKELSFLTPSWILGSELEKLKSLKFPVIIKPAYGLASFHMTKNSVCHNEQEVMCQIQCLNSKIGGEILIEEYIMGTEISVMLLETKDKGVVACKPIVYTFPRDLKETEQFLDFYTKNIGLEKQEVTFNFFEGDLKLENGIKEASIRAYEALGVMGSGYGRTDVRLTKDHQIYILEVNPTPSFFGKLGNFYGSDFVVLNSIPGGHNGLVKSIIDSKERLKLIFDYYNKNDMSLNLKIMKHQNKLWENVIQNSNYTSSRILDIGCGAGTLGKIIKKYHAQVELIGIEISPKMVKAREYYIKIYIGLVENIIMELDTNIKFDHIVGNGVFQYVDSRNFRKILYRLFELTKRTITITVEEISLEYQKNLFQIHPCNVRFNHVDILNEIVNKKITFDLKWFVAWERKDYIFTDERTQDEVYGKTICFSRMKSKHDQTN